MQTTDGRPLPNATVEIVGVDTSKINTSAGQTKLDRADELLKESSNPLPDSWKPDLSITGKDGLAANADAEYVAVHGTSDWAVDGWVDTIDLSSPKINPPAEREIVLSVWKPSREAVVENTVDDSLPGATVDRKVVVERIDPVGDVVDRQTYALDRNMKTGFGPTARNHPHATVSLPAGVYRVYPEGAENTAYTIVVGNKDDIRSQFATELEDRSDKLSNAAKKMQDRLDSGKFIRKTVTANETGHYSADVPAEADRVAVSSYSIDGETLTSMSEPTPQDMRAWIKNNDYNGSVYFSPEPRRYTTPTDDADVTVRKFSSPPYQALDAWADQWSRFRDLVENGTLEGVSTVYDVPLEKWNETQLEGGATDLSKIIEQNEQLRDQWEDRTGNDWDRFNEELEDQERQNEQLREDIRGMEDVIEGLRDELESEPPEISPNPGDGTVDFRQAFDKDFAKDSVAAVWKGYDGSSKPIPSEYVTVNKRTGRGDEVVVSDFPIPNDSAGGSVSVLVMSEDGELGRGSADVTNPAFDGEIPEIRSVDVSTLRPGPSEKVTLKPRLETSGVSIQGVEVYDEQGNVVNATLENGKARFTPPGTGVHYVRFNLSTSDGKGPFVESVRLPVGNTTRDYPPEVTVRDGRLGVFAVAGSEVSDARVKIEDSGSSLDVTALVEPDAGTNEVHYHLEDSPATKQQSITTRVVAGNSIETSTSLSRHVGVYVHGRELTGDAIVYRQGSGVDATRYPIPADGETRGGKRVDGEQGGTVIQSYTSKNGEATYEINNNPGRFDRLRYRFDVFVADVDVPIVFVSAATDVALELESTVGRTPHYPPSSAEATQGAEA